MISCTELEQKFYQEDQLDNDGCFRRKLEGCAHPGCAILDLGAGAGEKFRYDLKSKVEPSGEVVGADYDVRVCRNPLIHRGIVLNGTGLPFKNECFDVVFCRYVLEHVGDPTSFLSEIYRVLKPGGCFLFLTPNKWHYVSIASRLSPQAFHRWYNAKRGRSDHDTFPTLYRLNSRATIRRIFGNVGFIEQEIILRECCPNYLKWASPLFVLGIAFERLVNSSEAFSGIRVNILGHFKKPL